MKHIAKKITGLLFVVCFIFLSLFQCFAMNTNMSLSEASGNIDETIKININISDAEFSKAELKLEYNTNELSFEGFESGYISGLFSKTESGEYSKGNLYFKTTNETDILSGGTFCSAKFKILNDNNRSPIRANLTAYRQNGFRVSIPSAITYINSGTFKTNQTAAVLDNLNIYAIYGNNSKKQLSISPRFSQNNYSYCCTVDGEASGIAFSAYSKNGKVSVIGNSQLSNGENHFKINIDENNNNRITYSILINKNNENLENTTGLKFINTEHTNAQTGIISAEKQTNPIISNISNEKNTEQNNNAQKIGENSINKRKNFINKNKILFATISLIFSIFALAGFVYFYYLDFIKTNKHKKDKNNEKDSF